MSYTDESTLQSPLHDTCINCDNIGCLYIESDGMLSVLKEVSQPVQDPVFQASAIVSRQGLSGTL